MRSRPHATRRTSRPTRRSRSTRPIQTSLLDYALDLVGLKANGGMPVAGLPIQVKELLRGVAPLALYGDGKALARMEWVPLEDTIGEDDDE